jgi:hypothetical protein
MLEHLRKDLSVLTLAEVRTGVRNPDGDGSVIVDQVLDLIDRQNYATTKERMFMLESV